MSQNTVRFMTSAIAGLLATIPMTVVSHFAFGASAGCFYGPLCQPRSASGAITSGCIYGLGVWSCSYLGWLPATGLYRSAADETVERNTLMIAAHIVWGASLGLATHVLSDAEPGQLQIET